MIKSKAELYEYLVADRIALSRKNRRPTLNDWIWRFEINLRKAEYYYNCRQHDFFGRILYKWFSIKKFLWGGACGFEIPINVFDKGLSIAHKGTIVVNGGAKVGKNCRLHTCVNIGTAAGASSLAPKIGDNVYIAPGVKMFGDITIASNIIIGANAVVNQSFFEESISIGGVPAKKISDKGRFVVEEANKEKAIIQ